MRGMKTDGLIETSLTFLRIEAARRYSWANTEARPKRRFRPRPDTSWHTGVKVAPEFHFAVVPAA